MPAKDTTMTDHPQTYPVGSFDRRHVLLFAAGAVLTATVKAQSAQLDGRRFDGVFLERGKTKGDADTLLFQGGRFRSTACDRYGYSDSAYRVTPAGDALMFEAETESPKYGKLVWRGVVRGDYLNATATAVKDGKSGTENWIVAAVPR
jgi:hypothetical protein